MEIIILIGVGILGLMGVQNHIKIRSLEKRTERTFIEVEKDLNTLKRVYLLDYLIS